MLKIIKKYKYLITFILILVIICLVVVRKNNLKENNKEYTKVSSSDVLIKSSNPSESIKEEQTEKEKTAENNIKIDIKGQVINPGVYELSENARVIDAINMAGGLTDIANTSLINLSKKLEDQMVIIIYSNEEVLNSNVKEVETVFKVIEKECVCPNIKNDSCINTELDNNTNDDKENNNNDNGSTTNNNATNDENKLVNINTASFEELTTISGIGESKAKAIIEYRKENKFTTTEEVKNVSGIGDALFEKIKAFITV